MQFYNTTDTENSLVHEAWDLVDANITSYPLAKVTRRFNFALERIVGLLINADGTQEWDDTNFSDLPVATFNLTDAQESYSFASMYLKVKRMKVKDINGNWILLKQLDQNELKSNGISIEELFSSSGTPEYYDLLSSSFRLYPAPSSSYVTLTAGLKVDFKRTCDLFTVSDTTQEPGIPSPYHFLLPTWAALEYAKSYKKDRVPELVKTWDEGIKELLKHFALRNEDARPQLTMVKKRFR